MKLNTWDFLQASVKRNVNQEYWMCCETTPSCLESDLLFLIPCLVNVLMWLATQHIVINVFNVSAGVQQAVSDAHVVPLSIGGPMSIQLSWTHLPGPGYMWYFIQNSYATSVLYYNGQEEVPSGARVSSFRCIPKHDH